MINSESFSKLSGEKGEGQYTQDARIGSRLDVPDYNSNSGYEEGKIFEYEDANPGFENADGSAYLPNQQNSRILTAVQTKTVRNAKKKKKNKAGGAGAGKISSVSSRSNLRRAQLSNSPASKGRQRKGADKTPKNNNNQNLAANYTFSNNVLEDPKANQHSAAR